jgi:hypothetical protein
MKAKLIAPAREEELGANKSQVKLKVTKAGIESASPKAKPE